MKIQKLLYLVVVVVFALLVGACSPVSSAEEGSYADPDKNNESTYRTESQNSVTPLKQKNPNLEATSVSSAPNNEWAVLDNTLSTLQAPNTQQDTQAYVAQAEPKNEVTPTPYANTQPSQQVEQLAENLPVGSDSMCGIFVPFSDEYKLYNHYQPYTEMYMGEFLVQKIEEVKYFGETTKYDILVMCPNGEPDVFRTSDKFFLLGEIQSIYCLYGMVGYLPPEYKLVCMSVMGKKNLHEDDKY